MEQKRLHIFLDSEMMGLSATPGRGTLALAEVALIVGDFLEGLVGSGFLLVEIAVEYGGEDTLGVCLRVSMIHHEWIVE